MKEILKLYINITGFQKIEAENGCVQMILFSGKAVGPIFNGEIMPGGVDTQQYGADDSMTLSARYMINGTDNQGHTCNLFIENNGSGKVGEELITYPKIFTDSSALKYLELAKLTGQITNEDEQLVIKIFQDE